jgi:hypothetical protein
MAADMLAEIDDLSALLDETIDPTQGTHVLKLATAAVQAEAGQKLLQATETVDLMGTVGAWLTLPERPTTAVSLVELDGDEVTDYKRFGSRLWRSDGWATYSYEPAEVSVTYTHGWPAGDPKLEFAKSAVLVTAVALMDNPTSAVGMGIDDYREQYAQLGQAVGVVPAQVAKALRKHYGARAGLVQIG